MQNISENIQKTFENLSYLDKDSYTLIATNEATSLINTKIGGTPYIPKNASLPQNSKGQDLRFIAQINFEELEGDLLPIKQGILQFWALQDNLFGLNMENREEQDNCRTIFYPTIEQNYTKNELEEKFPSLAQGDPWGFPFDIDTCFKLSAKIEKSVIPLADFHFDEVFIEEYKKIDPTADTTSYWDFEDFLDDMFEQRNARGHKILGYADFCQEDIRSEDDYEDYILLFQLDSEKIGEKEILWGDNGLANWFIHPDDLKNKDFSKVLYTWDCY